MRRTYLSTNAGRHDRPGFSMLEVLLVVFLLGVLAYMVVPRSSQRSTASRTTSCHVTRGNIEVQAELWYRNKGGWPDADLDNIFNDPAYFPDGSVVCPVDGSVYSLDTSTGRVVGHDH